MRATEGNFTEIVFESDLEARLAAHLLQAEGRADLLDSISPPVDNPHVGVWEFVKLVGGEQRGKATLIPRTVDHNAVIPVLETLLNASVEVSMRKPTIKRREYMWQMLKEFSADTVQLALEGRIPIQTESMTLEPTPLQRLIASAISERNWTAGNLGPDQIDEIRSAVEAMDPSLPA